MFALTLGILLQLAGPGDTAPIRGRLIDRVTGEAVSNFEVSVELRKREPIRLVTDADGRYATEAEFKRTRFSLGLIDHPRSPEPLGTGRARVAHDPVNEELQEFRIVVGPRFELELVDANGAACPDPEQFDAFLYHDRPLARALPGGSVAPRAPVRSTGTVWARFRDRQCDSVLAGGPWWLEVRSLDGTSGGGVRIETLRPDAEAVRVEIEPRCIVRGVLRDQLGQALDGGALRLKRATDLTWHEQMRANTDGTFRFENLEDGNYELIVCDARARGLRQAIELRGGEVRDLGALAIERFSKTATLRGRITSVGGEYSGSGAIVLDPLDKELFKPIRANLSWQTLDDDKRVAAFEFDAYAGERYRIQLDTLDTFAWGTVLDEVSAEAPIEIVLDDRRQMLEILVADANTGEDIEAAEIAVSLGLYNEWLEGAFVVLRDIPLAVEPESFSWCVTAPGYVPVFGDLSAFKQVEEGIRALELKLEPGWGNRFDVYDRRTLRPLEGVEVRLDATVVGTTVGGSLDVRLDETPTTLDLSLEGYRWVGGSLDYRRIDILEEEAVPTLLWMAPNGTD